MTAMNTAVLTAIFLSLSCFTSPASAIYKCEQDDVITYTDIPCDGQQLSVTVPQKPRDTEEKSDEKSLAREKKKSQDCRPYENSANGRINRYTISPHAAQRRGNASASRWRCK